MLRNTKLLEQLLNMTQENLHLENMQEEIQGNIWQEDHMESMQSLELQDLIIKELIRLIPSIEVGIGSETSVNSNIVANYYQPGLEMVEEWDQEEIMVTERVPAQRVAQKAKTVFEPLTIIEDASKDELAKGIYYWYLYFS